MQCWSDVFCPLIKVSLVSFRFRLGLVGSGLQLEINLGFTKFWLASGSLPSIIKF